MPAGGIHSMTTAYGPYIRIISVSHKPTGPIGVYQVFKSLPNDPRLVRTWRGFFGFHQGISDEPPAQVVTHLNLAASLR